MMRSILFVAPTLALLSWAPTRTPAPAEAEIASAFHIAPTEGSALQAAYGDARQRAARACIADGGQFEELTAVEMTLEREDDVEASVGLGVRCGAGPR